MLKVSMAKAIINPEFPCKMEGYHEKRFSLFQKDEHGEVLDPMRTAYGARDNLLLDTIYIEAENGKGLVIHIPDIIMIEQSFGDRAKAALSKHFGMDENQFIISCSHTHASPLVSTGMNEDLEPNQEYLELLIEKMIENTAYCLSHKKEAEVTWDSHKIEGFYCSRQGLDVEYFDKIESLFFTNEEGFGVAKLLNMACHPTVLDNKNLLVSNDFFGVIRRYLQEIDGVPVAIANGEGGDTSTRLTKRAGDWEETVRIGEGIAKQIVKENKPQKLEFLDVKITEVPFTIDYVPSENEYLLHKKVELEEKLQNLDPASQEAILISACFLVDVNEKLGLDRIQYDLSSFIYDFGSFRLVTFPGEIDTQLAKKLRNADDKPTFVMAYTNGFYYYAVNKAEYGSNHESFNSRFPYGGADEFIEKIIASFSKHIVEPETSLLK